MEFKKCCRCGNFYISNNDVCPKCRTKDNLEFETFKSYISENGMNNDLNILSNATGISVKNINRYLNYTNINNGNPNIKL